VRRSLPAAVIALGVVSFFTDVSSEMIYPLLPLFLASVLGAGPAALGVIEGVAESTAALLKVVSGRWSDRARRRKPLIVAGYGLAGAARPLIGLAGSWPAVLALRFADRIGKGLRTAPRDALIADVTPIERRGEAFGVQRAFDHAGAVVGPLIAAALLGWAGLSLPAVFLLAAVPAVVVIAVLLAAVHEPPRPTPAVAPAGGAGSEPFGARFRLLLAAVVVFTLGNSTDAFLLLRLSDVGVAPARVALLWSAFHVVKAAATWIGGRLSDRLGRRPMVAAGWLLYAAVYLAFAVVDRPDALVAVFLTYGLYFGLTEPVERAWVVDLAPQSRRGAALGLYHGAVGFAALPASVLFGVLWQRFGAPAAFACGAGAALVATLLLLGVPAARGIRRSPTKGTATGV
jgi:MFS family permease